MGIVMGYGVNDCNYKVQIEEKDSEGKRIVVWRCPYYQVWSGMLKRVFSGTNLAYAGCSVDPRWKSFNDFRDWMQSQPEHDEWHSSDYEWALDKDLVEIGNRVYSPDLCILVPMEINSLFSSRNKKQKDLPLGVKWVERLNKFECQIHIDGKKKYLGLFLDPMEAHMKWAMYKFADVSSKLESYEDREKTHPVVIKRMNDLMLQLSTAISTNTEFKGFE